MQIYNLVDAAKGKDFFNALNHDLRRSILEFIEEKGRCTPSEIQEESGLAQGEISRQLSILRRANIIKPENSGRNIYYHIPMDSMEDIKLLFEIIGRFGV